MKQMSFGMPDPYWRVIREESATRGIPMTELVMEWIEPRISKLLLKKYGPDFLNPKIMKVKDW